jgi:hypothetical protein
MDQILFYPLGSMIVTLALFLSYYALRFKVEEDEDDLDDSHIIHRYEMIEAWENMVDDEPSNDVLCGLLDRKIDFQTIHGDVLIAYDYINGTFNYWTDRKDYVTYQMLLDIAREYSVNVGVKRIFLADDKPSGSDTKPSGSDAKPSGSDAKPSGSDDAPKIDSETKVSGGPFLRPKIKQVKVTIKLNSFKYKGTLLDNKDTLVVENPHISPTKNVSWAEWKSKNV